LTSNVPPDKACRVNFGKSCHAFVVIMVISSVAAQSLSQGLSQETAYEVMFREIVRVEADAAQVEQRGQSAADLRNRYKNLFGLNNRNDLSLKVAARSCLAEVNAFDARAAAIIQSTKDRFRPKSASGERAGSVPPLPAELVTLQQQKTATIRKWMDNLEEQIGRGDMALLSAAVRRHVFSHSKQTTATASQPR
jgi:hypothetical protein